MRCLVGNVKLAEHSRVPEIRSKKDDIACDGNSPIKYRLRRSPVSADGDEFTSAALSIHISHRVPFLAASYLVVPANLRSFDLARAEPSRADTFRRDWLSDIITEGHGSTMFPYRIGEPCVRSDETSRGTIR